MLKTNTLSGASLKALGFSGLSQFMAVFSYFAATMVTIVVILTIAYMALMPFINQKEASHHTYGTAQNNVSVGTTGVIIQQQVTTDPACMAEVHKNGGNDVSKCPFIKTQPSQADIAAAKKAPTLLMSTIYSLLSKLFFLLPIAALAVGLFQAGLCFSAIKKGRYFAPSTIRHLRNFAFAGLIYVIGSAFAPWLYMFLAKLIWWINFYVFIPRPITSFQIAIPEPYSPLGVAIGARSNFTDFLVTIYAFTLAIIATLMAKAAAIVDDHAQII